MHDRPEALKLFVSKSDPPSIRERKAHCHGARRDCLKEPVEDLLPVFDGWLDGDTDQGAALLDAPDHRHLSWDGPGGKVSGSVGVVAREGLNDLSWHSGEETWLSTPTTGGFWGSAEAYFGSIPSVKK